MNAPAPRFHTPITVARPRGARLLEGFSPRLERHVRLFRHQAFDYWIRLESDPAVRAFCERPARRRFGDRDLIVDFWVKTVSGEAFVLVMDSDPDSSLPEDVEGVPVQQIPLSEQSAFSVWTTNWQRILNTVVATRGSVPRQLCRSIIDVVRQPTSLADIERAFSGTDIPLLRGAVFELLRVGDLRTPELMRSSLGMHTCFEARS